MSPASAQVAAGDAKCRDGIAKAVGKLAKGVLKEQDECFQALARGTLSGVNCADLDDPAFPGALKVQKARQKLALAIPKACAGASTPQQNGYVLCPAPCSAIGVSDYASVASCMQCGTPVSLLTSTVVFELALTLDVSGGVIAPTAGTPVVSNVRVTENPIGASPAAFATGVAQFFPLAAQALDGLFGQVPLPSFQGLQLSGVASGYNVSCTAIYLNLTP